MSEILKISNVTKLYNNKFQALDNLSLNIKKGEIFALLGPNGAGKSTLINTICGILNFDGGCITVDEFNIKRFSTYLYTRVYCVIGLLAGQIAGYAQLMVCLQYLLLGNGVIIPILKFSMFRSFN